jgi:hypothetical protein
MKRFFTVCSYFLVMTVECACMLFSLFMFMLKVLTSTSLSFLQFLQFFSASFTWSSKIVKFDLIIQEITIFLNLIVFHFNREHWHQNDR